MNDNNYTQAQADMAAFAAPPPEEAAKQAKEREKLQKEQAKKVKDLTTAQLKAAERLVDSQREEVEAREKALLLRQLADYMKLMKEYHPDRLEFLKVPKNPSSKTSVDELRLAIQDIKIELGKKNGLDTCKVMWVEGFRWLEQGTTTFDVGLRLQGLGQIAEHSVLPRKVLNEKTQEYEIVHGPMIPTLAEFATEHADFFSSSINWRLFLKAAELVVAVHRMNSEMPVEKAANAPVSKETKEMMDKL